MILWDQFGHRSLKIDDNLICNKFPPLLGTVVACRKPNICNPGGHTILPTTISSKSDQNLKNPDFGEGKFLNVSHYVKRSFLTLWDQFGHRGLKFNDCAHDIPPFGKKHVHGQTASTTLQKPILKEIRLRPKKLDLSGASLKVSFYYQKL